MPEARAVAALLCAAVVLVAAGAGLRREAAAGPAVPPLAEVDGAAFRADPDAARAAGVPVLPPPGPVRFAPEVAAGHRAMVAQALAAAQPAAVRVVEAVAPVAVVRVGPAGRGVAGLTGPGPDGRYDVLLDLDGTLARGGPRAVSRLVLHELAHVVDRALSTTALDTRLDAATPRGYGCDEGHRGACASRAERFAESFAKWATGDITPDIAMGYAVPPPVPLATWGAPLAAALAR